MNVSRSSQGRIKHADKSAAYGGLFSLVALSLLIGAGSTSHAHDLGGQIESGGGHDDGGAPDGEDVDNSVMGRPFPVSESIFSDCDNSRRRHLCEPNLALLAEMAAEPREEPWASGAERAIRSLVELEPGTDRPRAVTYTIRALECRTTICFLETASIMQPFHTQLFYFERAHALRAGYSSFGTETDEFGNRTHVTLTPFTRN